jgi:hypothetical protein
VTTVHAGDAETDAGDVEQDRLPFEHGDTRGDEDRADLGAGAAVVVVIAEHRDDGDAEVAHLFRDHVRLRRVARVRQIPGEQQHVRVCGQPGQRRSQCSGRPDPDVQVADRGQADHLSASA